MSLSSATVMLPLKISCDPIWLKTSSSTLAYTWRRPVTKRTLSWTRNDASRSPTHRRSGTHLEGYLSRIRSIAAVGTVQILPLLPQMTDLSPQRPPSLLDVPSRCVGVLPQLADPGHQFAIPIDEPRDDIGILESRACSAMSPWTAPCATGRRCPPTPTMRLNYCGKYPSIMTTGMPEENCSTTQKRRPIRAELTYNQRYLSYS